MYGNQAARPQYVFAPRVIANRARQSLATRRREVARDTQNRRAAVAVVERADVAEQQEERELDLREALTR